MHDVPSYFVAIAIVFKSPNVLGEFCSFVIFIPNISNVCVPSLFELACRGSYVFLGFVLSSDCRLVYNIFLQALATLALAGLEVIGLEVI